MRLGILLCKVTCVFGANIIYFDAKIKGENIDRIRMEFLTNLNIPGNCSTLYTSTDHSTVLMAQADHLAIRARSRIQNVRVNSGCILNGYLETDLTVEILKVFFF